MSHIERVLLVAIILAIFLFPWWSPLPFFEAPEERDTFSWDFLDQISANSSRAGQETNGVGGDYRSHDEPARSGE